MGPYLSSPIRDKKTHSGENARVKYASCEMQGWRNTMEDAKLAVLDLADNMMLFGVFDGHGGKEVAEFVSRHLPSELLSNRDFQSKNYEQALKTSFLRMDELIRSTEGMKEVIRISKDLPENYPVQADPSLLVAGCTSVVALVVDNVVYVANAGDSRCIINRDGRAIELSIDHKPELPQERDRIIRAGGMVEDGRVMGNLNLSRSIGDLEYKKNNSIPAKDQMISAYPDVRIENLCAKDSFIILACDGVWDMLTSQECVDYVAQRIKNKPLTAVAEDVLDRCLAPDIASSGGLGCDNTTIVIVELKH